jgi:uncharacterized membrane protein
MTSPRRTRSDVIDIARAVALIAMFAYHLIWDLADNGFIDPAAPFTPGMRWASNAIASAFLALVGLSLVLADRGGRRSGAFLKRLTIIAAAAVLVTATTFVIAPQAPIWFGILHCIALASLFAAPLMRIPAMATVAIGLLALLAPKLFSFEAFDAPFLQWIGLGKHAPSTLDWRPLLPWAGVVWLTLGLAGLAPNRFWRSSVMVWRARGRLASALAWLGRHSLALYLAHQPVLFASLFVASAALSPGVEREREAFLAACRPACVESGGGIETCERSCACVADKEIKATMRARFISKFWRDRNGAELAVQSCMTEAN